MRLLPLCLAASIAATIPCPAFAQYREERPYRGLFRSGLSSNAQQSLIFNGSLSAGFDNNVLANARSGERLRPSDLNTAVRGGVGQATGSLSYGLDLGTVSLGASGGTSLHYYPSLASPYFRRYQGSVRATVQLTRYLSGRASFGYQPFSLSSMFPITDGQTAVPMVPGAGGGLADAGTPDTDFASSIEHYRSYEGGVDYTRPLSRRLEFTADYGFRRRDASLVASQYSAHRAGGGLRYETGRGLALRAQYRHAVASHASTGRHVRHHVIDAGVDYTRALSFSRRTMLSFRTGTAAVTRPDAVTTRTTFRLVGNARLTHELGRTWNAALAYARSARFDEDWPDLVSSDSLTATLGGMVSRRLQFSSSAHASTGTIGLSERNQRFDGYYGRAGLSYALSRHLSAGVTYAFYRHRFDAGVTLPADFVNHFNRHSVKASVSVWAPIFER